jgi:hypothetical protein
MHLAWQNLLHADLTQRNENIHFKNNRGHYERGKDGEKRTWGLQECLKFDYKDNDPTRLNVEFFIGLRNKIEHRFQDAFMVAVAAHAHALVINFERELVARFGSEQSLADELRFPLFVQSLTPAGMEEQRKLRKQLPAAGRTYITQFEDALDESVAADERFVYRVLLTPVKGTKGDADLAVTFVREDALTDEEKAEIKKLAKEGKVVLADKFRDVALENEMLPAAATEAINSQLPFVFNSHHFLIMRRLHKVRPEKGQPATDTQAQYCVYSKPHKNHVYTPAYVAKCVKELNTRDKWMAIMGKEPTVKENAKPLNDDASKLAATSP